tara:strand:+ start:28 stop:759 length:732 start_codon:yes stop_codon:yes gene_type:complete
MDRISRQIANSKQDRIQIVKSQPSAATLREGQEVIYITKDNKLARYRKEQGRLWVSYMDSDLSKNVSIEGNLNLSGKLFTNNYPAFSVYQSTSVDEQALATSTWTRITLDTENYDNGNNFSSNYFTAPYHGIYHFDGKILLDSNADSDAGDFDAKERLDCSLFKNASSATYGSSSLRVASSLHLVAAAITDSVWEARLSTDLELDAGDYIGMYAWQNTGVEQHTYSPAIDDWTRFTGHLVCAL